MISLEQLTDGSVSARNFETLRRLVIDTGGQSIGLRFGTQTLTWAGALQSSDFPTVTHGLGKTPVIVIPFGMSGLSAGTAWPVPLTLSYNATTFIVQAKTHDESTPAAATTCTVGWLAIG